MPALPSAAPLVLDARLLQRQDRVVLDMDLRLELAEPVLSALDHGIPVILLGRLRGESAATLFGRPVLWRRELRTEIRYLPMSGRWQVREWPGGREAGFRSRAALLAYLDQWRDRELDLPVLPEATVSWRIELLIDVDSLPPPLRLPALFDSAWRWRLRAGPFPVAQP